MALIRRDIYVGKVLDCLGKGLMIVLTGQRRVGKSCVLQCVMDALQEGDATSNIIYINKEYSDFRDIATDRDLDAYVAARLKEGVANYLFIDEVQDIDHFENTLRSLQAKAACEIVVTGSNAKMLSSELSTYLSGRYIELHVHSLNYAEFLLFHHLEDSAESFLRYLTFGGLPQLAQIGLENKPIVANYLNDIYNTVILKDVISRESIRNPRFLTDLTRFVADNMGKNISPNSISKFMKGQGLALSPALVTNYLGYLCNAFIIDRTPRYDIHGRRLFETNEKYYFEDLGLRNHLAGANLLRDVEKLLENVVYLHLCQQGYRVTVGQLQRGEVDFVAEKDGGRMYVQVCYMLSLPETMEREFGNLRCIADQYPKLVVCMDPLAAQGHYEGVRCLNVREFLLA